jgi:hypothetical protein
MADVAGALVRLADDPRPDLPALDAVAEPGDATRELVPEDDGRPVRVLVVEDVDVGAADARGAHVEDDPARRRLRRRHVAQLDVALAARRLDDRFHARDLTSRPRRRP